MTEDNPRYFRKNQIRGERDIDELARRQGITKYANLEDLLAGPDVFESDEELDAFLKHLREQRGSDHA